MVVVDFWKLVWKLVLVVVCECMGEWDDCGFWLIEERL